MLSKSEIRRTNVQKEEDEKKKKDKELTNINKAKDSKILTEDGTLSAYGFSDGYSNK